MRKIKLVKTAVPTLEGAGVHLQRVFGYSDTPLFDPFLMLDDFRNDKPENYLPGFPWHPHRGIETITYMLEGSAEHGDSLGNSGVIGKGDVQWMTAGSGIIHQEMPKPDPKGRMYGFQVWANLPAQYKMMKPRYQDIKAEQIPVLRDDQGAELRLICGSYKGNHGPVTDIMTDPQYWDVRCEPERELTFPTTSGYNCFIYCYAGSATIDGRTISNRQVVLFEDGDRIGISTGAEGFSFLFLSGKPLNEPISWRGPIVMNTSDEIKQAFRDLEAGRFIRK
ncbi:MAG TPA: pirin family protein [Candidatus Cloacimonadota bacterium]|nr:pirin family protein [Candidatus Cloacimonadota bacterium]